MYHTMGTKKGSLEVICGSMFSGKTEDLMRRLRRAEFAQKKVVTIKPRIDNRKSITCIVSHDGNQREAALFDHDHTLFDSILTLCSDPEISVVGIDEVQFFSIAFITPLIQMVLEGKRVITAGLDLDFKGEPFVSTALLLAHADYITKHKAICVICGADAHHTQRLIDGHPARYQDPVILVGAKELYQPRCRSCFVINKNETEASPCFAESIKESAWQK